MLSFQSELYASIYGKSYTIPDFEAFILNKTQHVKNEFFRTNFFRTIFVWLFNIGIMFPPFLLKVRHLKLTKGKRGNIKRRGKGHQNFFWSSFVSLFHSN